MELIGHHVDGRRTDREGRGGAAPGSRSGRNQSDDGKSVPDRRHGNPNT